MHRYKEDQDRDVVEANQRAKLAAMTEEERRQWELANPKVSSIACSQNVLRDMLQQRLSVDLRLWAEYTCTKQSLAAKKSPAVALRTQTGTSSMYM